jgi:hypothetical protein
LEGGINLFAYVANDPVNWIDSQGLSFTGALRGAVKGGIYGAGVGAVLGGGIGLAAGSVTGPGALVSAAAGAAGGAYDGFWIGALYGSIRGALDLDEDSGTSYTKTGRPTTVPPGYWQDGAAGAEEWARRNRLSAREGRNRFHRAIKGGCGGRGKDKFRTNPDTGDVIDPEGNIVGNLGEVRAK